MNLDIGSFKAVQVGAEIDGKPKAIRVSFPSQEIRNEVCRQSSSLPKNVSIEKCLPQRYRKPNREFRTYAWQLREAANVQTRIVFKGHKLVLEMKQPNEGEIKFDWTIAREYFPQPESPTDRSEAERDRRGFRPSKTIEQLETNKVFISNLNVLGNDDDTKEYFKNSFLTAKDKDKDIKVDAAKATTKKLLVVTLASPQDCSEFRKTYEKKEFNGHVPRISVMLGKS